MDFKGKFPYNFENVKFFKMALEKDRYPSRNTKK
tara:strand:- start:299 stop:400 length:102 start_codon:yes stop_codon:yes gene_type:complete